MVLCSIYHSKTFENVVQYYIINLAITDIAFITFCIPITIISYHTDGWMFGRLACQLSHFLTFVRINFFCIYRIKNLILLILKTTVCGNCLTLMMMTIGTYIYIWIFNYNFTILFELSVISSNFFKDRYVFICCTNLYKWRKPIYVLYVTIVIWIGIIKFFHSTLDLCNGWLLLNLQF